MGVACRSGLWGHGRQRGPPEAEPVFPAGALEQVFPETDVPFLSEIADACEGIFELVALRNDREHYRRTLQEWKTRLEAARTEAIAAAGEEKFRDFRRYLLAARTYFGLSKLYLFRIAFRRIGEQETLALSGGQTA